MEGVSKSILCFKKIIKDFLFTPSVIFIGSVMVWGCFAKNGVGNLDFIPTTMTKEVYIDLLNRNLKESARKLGLTRSFTFQQDNDPKHTAKVVQQWFQQQHIKVMDWPAQSPDLNPIENLWNELDRKLRRRPDQPKNVKELENFLKEEWAKIDQETTAKLVGSMPRRIQAVKEAKGGHTKY